MITSSPPLPKIVQPRGFTREQIEQPDTARARALRAEERALLEQLVPLAPLASSEFAHNVLARSGESLASLRAEVAPLLERRPSGGPRGA